MSGTIVLTLIYAMIQKVPLTIFAHDSSIQPIPSNYSAPLSENQETKKSDLQVIGFLPAWSVSQEVKVYPEYLDQIIFFGFTTDAEGNIQKKDKNDEYTFEWNTFTSRYFEDLREQAKKTNTKVLVSIKGLDNNKIESIFLHPTYRQNLIRQIKELVEGYKLDGVNIDFEYFSSRDSEIMTEHNRFFKDLNDEMKKIRSDMIVSSDVNATVVYRDGAYDMVKIADSIDQVIIMGYDYHWLESQEGGPVAPIEAEGDDPSITKTIDSIKGRVSSDKIILGIPLYGYEWQTKTQEKVSRYC
jgi:spore germination protein YaaH